MVTSISPKNKLIQNPRDSYFAQDPYVLYRQLHKTGKPIFWENYGFWCLSSFASVNSVLRDRRFARLPPPGFEATPLPQHLNDFAAAERHSLLALEPPEHTRLRKLVNSAFVSRQINQMAAGIERLSHECIDRFEEHGNIELLEHYATPIPVTVIARLLGVPESASDQLIAWSHAMVRVYTLTQTHEEEVMANTAAIEFQAFLLNIIGERRLKPADDLISHLLAKPDLENALSDEEIISVAILLLNAGHEATVHQLGNAIHTLLKQYPRHCRAQLLDQLTDDGCADALVTESLRYDAPLHLFMRYAQEAVEFDDELTLAPGDQVGLLLAAGNRCPIRFENAEQFVPTRTDGTHLSFGAGIHYCVGAQLAKLELRIALQVLFKRLPNLRLQSTVHYQNTYHFHGLENLPVAW